MASSKIGEQTPLISVMICSYNGERYLAKTIESVLNQTYANLELIIVDDGSTDKTINIIKKYKKQDARIKLFQQAHQGFAVARNRALCEASGDWIAIIDHDDLCYSTRLEKQLSLSREYPDADFCFCDTDFIDEDDNIIGSQFSNFTDARLSNPFIEKKMAALMLLQLGGFVDSESVFMRRGVAERVGMFKSKYLYAVDYDFFIRAGFEVNFCFTREKLSAWRVHQKQATKNNKTKLNLEIIDVLMSHLTDKRLDTKTRFCIFKIVIKSLIKTMLKK